MTSSTTTASLSTIAARRAADLVRAARLLEAFPRRSEIALGQLGLIGLESAGLRVREAADDASSGEVALGISNGLDRGRLVLDGALARSVLARALGGGDGAGVLAPLGHGERGVVAGLVAGVLHAADAPFSVSLAAPRLSFDGGAVFAVAVTVSGVGGWARLEVPSSWLARTAPRVSDAVLAASEVELGVELARTTLTCDEVAALEPGDAVVFDDEPSFLVGRPVDGVERAVRVVLGAHAARARLDAEGNVRLEEPIELPAAIAEELSGADEASQAGRGAGPGDATIEVVAELGRIRLGGAEVAGLDAGVVLALRRTAASPVTLRVGGEARADGALVEVDGALAVRLTTTRNARR